MRTIHIKDLYKETVDVCFKKTDELFGILEAYGYKWKAGQMMKEYGYPILSDEHTHFLYDDWMFLVLISMPIMCVFK